MPMFQNTNIPSCQYTKNQRTRTKKQEPKNEKAPVFCFSGGKMGQNRTFGISFYVAVEAKQVVLLSLHGSAALTKVTCWLLA